MPSFSPFEDLSRPSSSSGSCPRSRQRSEDREDRDRRGRDVRRGGDASARDKRHHQGQEPRHSSQTRHHASVFSSALSSSTQRDFSRNGEGKRDEDAQRPFSTRHALDNIRGGHEDRSRKDQLRAIFDYRPSSSASSSSSSYRPSSTSSSSSFTSHKQSRSKGERLSPIQEDVERRHPLQQQQQQQQKQQQQQQQSQQPSTHNRTPSAFLKRSRDEANKHDHATTTTSTDVEDDDDDRKKKKQKQQQQQQRPGSAPLKVGATQPPISSAPLPLLHLVGWRLSRANSLLLTRAASASDDSDTYKFKGGCRPRQKREGRPRREKRAQKKKKKKKEEEKEEEEEANTKREAGKEGGEGEGEENETLLEYLHRTLLRVPALPPSLPPERRERT